MRQPLNVENFKADLNELIEVLYKKHFVGISDLETELSDFNREFARLFSVINSKYDEKFPGFDPKDKPLGVDIKLTGNGIAVNENESVVKFIAHIEEALRPPFRIYDFFMSDLHNYAATGRSKEEALAAIIAKHPHLERNTKTDPISIKIPDKPTVIMEKGWLIYVPE